MTAPDVVYVVRPGADNEELRYSLRSIAEFLPHGKVWVIGTIPSFVNHDWVNTIELSPQREKFANQRASLVAACNHPWVSSEFILLNDDHFVIEPIVGELPTFHMGPHSEYIVTLKTSPTNTWRRAMAETATWMASQGVDDPIAYEAHVPLLFARQKLADALAAYPRDKRFAAGVTYELTGAGGEGVNAGNAKVSGLDYDSFKVKRDLGMPFLSTNDDSFERGIVGEFLRNLFPEPGPYEEAS